MVRMEKHDPKVATEIFLRSGAHAFDHRWQVEASDPRAPQARCMRYGELRALIPGLSDKMLTQRLKDLEQSGLVRRRKSGRRGAPSSYELTVRAQSLRPALQSLNDWGERVADGFGARVEPRGLPLP